MQELFFKIREMFIKKILGIGSKPFEADESNLISNKGSSIIYCSSDEPESYSASPVLLNRKQYRNSLDKINIDIDE